jgi:hypothetical protein
MENQYGGWIVPSISDGQSAESLVRVNIGDYDAEKFFRSVR